MMVNLLRANCDLAAVGLASLIAVAIPGPLRMPFGLALCLFLPGYGVVAVMYAEIQALRWVERIALSIGSSIVILVLTALVFSYSPWDHLPNIMPMALALIAVFALLIAWLRRRECGDEGILLDLTSCRVLRSRRIIFAISIASVIAGFSGYSLSRPGPSEAFTSFYVLRANDTIGSYSSTGTHTVHLIVGISNHEQHPNSYRVDAHWRSGSIASVRTGIVQDGRDWRHALQLTTDAKEPRLLQLFLFRAGSSHHAYRSLLLRVPVRAASW